MDPEGPGEDPFAYRRSLPPSIISLETYGQEISFMGFEVMTFLVLVVEWSHAKTPKLHIQNDMIGRLSALYRQLMEN